MMGDGAILATLAIIAMPNQSNDTSIVEVTDTFLELRCHKYCGNKLALRNNYNKLCEKKFLMSI